MSGKSILLVDDEVQFASTLAERLELRGYEIRLAHNGRDAIDLTADRAPDVVILDVLMPGIGGLEVLRRIKKDLPELPVILLTGRGNTSEASEGIKLGAADCLTKPISINELIQKIRECTGD